MSDRDSFLDYDDAYDQAYAIWAPWLSEARDDLKNYLGDQFKDKEKAYLTEQRRNAVVFNKIRRVIQLVNGYQRKNRLSMRVDPVEGSDDATASQLSGCLQWLLQKEMVYHKVSECFTQGPLKVGLSLLELYNSYMEDPVNGDLKFKRLPFTKLLLDPTFAERDLSDCNYILRREWPTLQEAKGLLPFAAKELENLPQGKRDNKFVLSYPQTDSLRKSRLIYDEFWRRDVKPVKAVVHRKTGQWKHWPSTEERLRYFLELYPDFVAINAQRRIMKLTVMVQGEVFYDGEDPLGIGDYPFVPFIGFWDPEYDNMRLKLQGLIRCMKDPQTENNRRISKMLDIMDSQISSGWIAEENTVVNPKDLYASGQGRVIWVRSGALASQRLKEKTPADVPQGMFQMQAQLDREILEIPGANMDLLGMPEKGEERVAGILSKMRQSQGLTVLQEPFDNLGLSMKLLGEKTIKAIQQNWQAYKVARIISQQPTKEFYDKDFGKYDAIPVETVLTDSQRQTYFQQLLELKNMGAPIPWTAILAAAPIEKKDELQQIVAAEEKAASEMANLDIQERLMLQRVLRAKAEADVANAHESRAGAALDRAKTVTEVQGIQFGRLLETLNIIDQLENSRIERQARMKEMTQSLQSGSGGQMM